MDGDQDAQSPNTNLLSKWDSYLRTTLYPPFQSIYENKPVCYC